MSDTPRMTDDEVFENFMKNPSLIMDEYALRQQEMLNNTIADGHSIYYRDKKGNLFIENLRGKFQRIPETAPSELIVDSDSENTYYEECGTLICENPHGKFRKVS